MNSARNSKFTKQYNEMSYSIHQRKLSEIQKRKHQTKPDNYDMIEQFKRNQIIMSKQNKIKKYTNIANENDRIQSKINQVTSSFKRSSSRTSVRSNQSNNSNQSTLQAAQSAAKTKRLQENLRLQDRLKNIQSSIKSHNSSQSLKSNKVKKNPPSHPINKSFQVSKIDQIKLLSFPSNTKKKSMNQSPTISNAKHLQFLPFLQKQNPPIIQKSPKSQKGYQNKLQQRNHSLHH